LRWIGAFGGESGKQRSDPAAIERGPLAAGGRAAPANGKASFC
jgi:hypothetical protein